MNKIYVGIDNGVTGSIAILSAYTKNISLYKTPIISQQSYTKTKQTISRLDCHAFLNIIDSIKNIQADIVSPFVIIERPMVNPTRFKATMSALRCLEAMLICLEMLKYPYIYIDSKQWQKELLPQGTKKEQLKKASLDIGCRLFPHLKNEIIKQKDADALLIAEYARRNNL